MEPEFARFPGKFYTALQDLLNRWSREPVFDRIDVNVFYEAHCSLTNVDKNNVGRVLASRMGNGSLKAEREFFSGLAGLLADDVKKYAEITMPPSAFQKKVLLEHLKKKIGFVQKPV